MKFVFYALMIPIAFFVGKAVYAPLFTEQELDGLSNSVVEIQLNSPIGKITEIVDFHDVDPADYPEKITLSEATVLADKNGLSPLQLDSGSAAKPLSLDGMVLEITSPLAAHLTGSVSVLDTDFAERVAKKRMDRRIAAASNGTPAVAAAESTTKKSERAAKKRDRKKSEPEKEAVAAVAETAEKEEMEKEEMVKEEAQDEPEDAPKTAARGESSGVLSAEQIVAAMKASLEASDIKGIEASKVTSWEAADDESFDGLTFQVGIVLYEEKTILGPKTLEAKALFTDGKLAKWIHSKTGLQIR